MIQEGSFSRFATITTRTLFGLVLMFAFFGSGPEAAQAAALAKKPMKCPYIHFVQNGDTLGIIALKYGIGVKEILDANNLYPPYKLVKWQPLCIPRIAFKKLYPKASLKASIFTDRLTIYGTCFPSWHPYKVRVRSGGSGSWKVVGLLRVKGDGSFNAHYKIPKSLIKSKRFQVCIKEQGKGYKACTNVNLNKVSGTRVKWKGMWVTIPSR